MTVEESLIASVSSVAFRLNGQEVVFKGDARAKLLYVLRNDFGLKGTRFGCGSGDCGACMILIGGRPTNSCDIAVSAVEGLEIGTVEGLGETVQGRALLRAFTAHQAAQCGYCISGILLSAAALLQTDPSCDEQAIRAALDRHLCRCGSHARILRAIKSAAQELANG